MDNGALETCVEILAQRVRTLEEELDAYHLMNGAAVGVLHRLGENALKEYVSDLLEYRELEMSQIKRMLVPFINDFDLGTWPGLERHFKTWRERGFAPEGK